MLTVWNSKSYKMDKMISSEIDEKNILSYKRRSKLINKTYSYEKNKVYMSVENEIKTLKNCYDFLYDLKNTLSDYISMVKEKKRKFTEIESFKLVKILQLSESEILSTYHSYNSYKEKEDMKYTLKQKKDISQITKKINDVIFVVSLLSKEIIQYF